MTSKIRTSLDADALMALARNLGAAAGVDEIEAILAGAGVALVPVTPPEGLLVSMALRRDHGFLSPSDPLDPLGTALKDVAITEMRQLHEEVVGAGFHRAGNDAAYVEKAKAIGVRTAAPGS